MSEAVISLRNVSKCFKRYAHPGDRLKEILLPGKPRAEEFWALRDVTLEIPKGSTFGVIGRNGAGKSTLLQIIAGTLQPTTGTVHTHGRISALLELGSGFNPEFTGRQNVFFNGRILGLSYSEVAEKFDKIAAFADIGEFIDLPTKTYSSGMFVRLAFAVAINVNPEILIVDEALSVGDGVFVHRCMAKIKDFQDSGGTILFVSHDVGAVTRLCSQTAWIKDGTLAAIGEPAEIARRYQSWVYDEINAYQKGELKKVEIDEAPKEQLALLPSQNPFTGKPYKGFADVERFGTGRAEIVEFAVLNEQGKPTNFVCPGDVVRVVIKAMAFDAVKDPFVGVMVYDRLRTAITGFNTYQLERKLPSLSAEEALEVEFCFEWPEFQGGNYTLEPALAEGTQASHEMLDWLQCPLSLVSSMTDLTFGILRVPEIQVSHRT